MNQSIPASQLVAVNPSVIGAGGTGLQLNGLVLTTSTRVPIGTVASFASSLSVAAFFGAGSAEATIAATYFLGYSGATITPGALLFAQYAWASPVAAYLQSGPVSSLTLAQLQAIQGTLIVTIDGVTFTSSSFNLAAATSFSNAATLIQTALGAVEASVTTSSIAPAVGVTAGTSTITNNVLTVVTQSSGANVPGAVLTGTGVTAGTTIVSQLTGTAGGAGTYQVSVAQTVSATAITATNAAAGILTIGAVSTGTVTAGQNVAGGTTLAGTVITGLLTSTGGAGTAIVTPSQTVTSTSMTLGTAAVTYDSVSGCFFITGGAVGAGGTIGFATGTASTALKFTAATGALTSQGSALSTPNAFMTAILGQTQNWFSFFATFDPVVPDKQAFAAWTNAQGVSYCYIMASLNVALTTNNYSSTAWGLIQATNAVGTLPVYDPNILTDSNVYSASVAGFFASLNFNEVNGRQTLAYRSTAGLAGAVTSGSQATQLIANSVNFYGVYGSANNLFTWWQAGSISGPWLWADTYAQAVQLKNALQLACLNLLQAIGNIPYNNTGAVLIETACLGPINAALNYGTIRAGVTLSALQIAEVNNAAGLAIDGTLFARGWYIQVGVATASVRAARQSPPITIWYCDGQSVQSIVIASEVIE